MDTPTAVRWLDAYFAAWESTDPAQVGALFSADAEYWVGPFAEPLRGRDAIATQWVTGTSVLLDHAHTLLAATDEHVVAHWSVRLGQASGAVIDIDGILLLTFDDAGACTTHREWFVSQPVAP